MNNIKRVPANLNISFANHAKIDTYYSKGCNLITGANMQPVLTAALSKFNLVLWQAYELENTGYSTNVEDMQYNTDSICLEVTDILTDSLSLIKQYGNTDYPKHYISLIMRLCANLPAIIRVMAKYDTSKSKVTISHEDSAILLRCLSELTTYGGKDLYGAVRLLVKVSIHEDTCNAVMAGAIKYPLCDLISTLIKLSDESEDNKPPSSK